MPGHVLVQVVNDAIFLTVDNERWNLDPSRQLSRVDPQEFA